MTESPLFIVDNSDGGRSGLGYLRDWCEIASSIDIATGFFEIGALIDLDGEWQKLEKIRILMGDPSGNQSKRALLRSVSDRCSQALDRSVISEKTANPFLNGTAAIVEAMSSGKIECRIYTSDKFHAKAYITHGRLDVVGSKALVGSSNFTRPGLSHNVELNIMQESQSEVAQLQAWFDRHWDDAEEVTAEMIDVVTKHTRTFSPFEVYSRALHQLFQGRDETDLEWEQNSSRMFPLLDRYQQEAYWGLRQIAERHGGALLCDGVGLGKTYVGLMLIERLVRDGKKVVLFAPKAVNDSVWRPDLRAHLGDVAGIGNFADFSNLTVFNHTDLTRPGDFPDRFAAITEAADAVVIDEAHHFRNRGTRGLSPEEVAEGEIWVDERSRYHRMFDLINGGPKRKEVYLLTATPINNSLNDFRHLVELFTNGDDTAFARTLGVNSLTARMKSITKEVQRRQAAETGVDSSEVGADAEAVEDALVGDDIFRNLVIQRSRSYAKQSQIQEKGSAAAFPERNPPVVADYSLKRSYGRLLETVDNAFRREKPLFSLALYYPAAYYIGDDEEIFDAFEKERQKQVVGLIRTSFLKRFESSAAAFERSCDRLARKLILFVRSNAQTESEIAAVDEWIDDHSALLAEERSAALDAETDDSDPDDDVEEEEFSEVDDQLVLARDEFDVAAMIAESMSDLELLGDLLRTCRALKPEKDQKLQRLIDLLLDEENLGHKVMVFSEYADTARYLRDELRKAGVERVAQIDSGTKANRAEVLKRFAPYYNRSSSSDLEQSGLGEIQVLIATDVLSEGLNLQDATRLVNDDIHWNPVRLMQRIGRVDRRMNPEIEARILADHPELENDRGRVTYWNFLPPEELDSLLSLYKRVTHKTLLISETLGIEHGQLLSPDDNMQVLREFNEHYEGAVTPMEDLHLEYQRLLAEDPGLERRLEHLPAGIFSGKAQSEGLLRGVFFCYRLPGLDLALNEFTLEAGETRWYLCPVGDAEVVEDPAAIAQHVRSATDTARRCIWSEQYLLDARTRVSRFIKDGYMRQLGVPMTAPDPLLVGWMELNGD